MLPLTVSIIHFNSRLSHLNVCCCFLKGQHFRSDTESVLFIPGNVVFNDALWLNKHQHFTVSLIFFPCGNELNHSHCMRQINVPVPHVI